MNRKIWSIFALFLTSIAASCAQQTRTAQTKQPTSKNNLIGVSLGKLVAAEMDRRCGVCGYSNRLHRCRLWYHVRDKHGLKDEDSFYKNYCIECLTYAGHKNRCSKKGATITPSAFIAAKKTPPTTQSSIKQAIIDVDAEVKIHTAQSKRSQLTKKLIELNSSQLYPHYGQHIVLDGPFDLTKLAEQLAHTTHNLKLSPFGAHCPYCSHHMRNTDQRQRAKKGKAKTSFADRFRRHLENHLGR